MKIYKKYDNHDRIPGKRIDIIKNIARIFLVIVLLLSLFSFLRSPDPSQVISDKNSSQLASNHITANVKEKTADFSTTKKLAEEKANVLISAYGATSVQYAVISQGNIIVSGQAGVFSKDSNVSISDKSMYGIGSISKIFTAVAVMQLVDQGIIDLDTPVVDYIPEFSMADSRYKNITVKMLLNHSSGLMGSNYTNILLLNDEDDHTYQSLLEYLKPLRLKANPGSYSTYCNDGYSLAQLLIEKVTGKSFTEYIKSNISDKLGLVNTKTTQDDFSRDSIVKTYYNGVSSSLPTESCNVVGAGGIYSTANNLCKLAQIFMKDGSSDVLSAASAEAMADTEYLSDLWPDGGDFAEGYGLGWDNVNTYPFHNYNIKALSKGGDTVLFHGSFIVLPEQNMAIAVLSSGGLSTLDQLMAQEVLLQALKDNGSINRIMENKTFQTPVIENFPDSQRMYSGVYANYGDVYKVTISDAGVLSLISLINNSGQQSFTYTSDGKYYSADGSMYASFVQESNGLTYLKYSGYQSVINLGQAAINNYVAQKIDNIPISKEVKIAWEKRLGKNYFIVNEKYSSVLFLNCPYKKISMLSDLDGYCFNAAIIDRNSARTMLQIPGSYGRDLVDYVFYKDGGREYLKNGGGVFISEDYVKVLSQNTSTTYKIASNGYGQWYKIDMNSANKKVKVTVPKNASFAVYDTSGTCINFSYISNLTSVTLPENGYLVFLGEPNAEFTLKYIK